MLRVDQGLINKFITAFPTFPTAHENSKYTPVAGTAYAELYVNPNDQTAFSCDTDVTDGLFKIILRYPVNAGAITAKTMADSIFSIYPVDSYIYYPDTTGQKTEITGISRDTGYHEAGWYKLVISIRYNAFIRR